MENLFEKLNLFFDRIKSISLWQRLFGWKSLQALSYDAYDEFRSLLESLSLTSAQSDKKNQLYDALERDHSRLVGDHRSLEAEVVRLKEENERLENKNSQFSESIATKEETIRLHEKRISELEQSEALLKQKIDVMESGISALRQENAAFNQTKESQEQEFEKKLAVLTGEIERVRNERQAENEAHQRLQIERLERMKGTWAAHQKNTKAAIKLISQRHTIEYIDKVPFKGDPDNTLKIAGEFVVFDAKSPATEDLENFPIYIKGQADAVKKYVKEEGVRKDVFFVVPSNTVGSLEQFTYNMADYTVYVVTLDVLEPLVLSLKKIENYEFLDQLTPEERENICRVIGKFAHTAKRRIQIDHFFALEFLEILTRCKADLPKDVLEKVVEFEKFEKLNPPQERRSKQLLTKDLQADSEKIQREAEAKEILFPPSLAKDIKTLPLYENEGADSQKHE